MCARFCTSRENFLEQHCLSNGVVYNGGVKNCVINNGVSMLVKRILLVVISLIIGYVATYLITLVLGTSVEEFWMGPEQPVPFPYFILVGFFIALAVAIWLDKFMGTEILPK